MIVPDFTFFATAEMVALLGAIPVFADIHPATWNLDPQDVERKISPRTKGIITTSLFGQCSDMKALGEIANAGNLWFMEDAAQSFGAMQNGKMSCNLSPIAATSFFPAKPLGAYGKGGAIFCQDPTFALRVRSLLNHGQEGRYHHTSIGINGRMDTIQAAILLVKLRHFAAEQAVRESIANRYLKNLGDTVSLPTVLPGNSSAWAQFTVMHPQRDRICANLAKQGIPTSIHYPKPLHQQPVFESREFVGDPCPESTKSAQQVFSLPIHAFMKMEQVDQICEALMKASHEATSTGQL